MDFFQSQDVARRRTAWLIVLLVAAVISIIVLVYLLLAGAVVIGSEYNAHPHASGQPMTLWHPQLLLFVGLGVILFVGGGSFYKIASLRGGGHSVAEMLGGKPLDPAADDPQGRMLLNVVEEMAIASGTPVPPVYVLDDSAINAFAAGYSPQDAVIGITRGALDTLNRDELQGVIAHEFSHIINGDMRLNIRLIGIVHGILVIALVGYGILRAAIYSGASRRRSSKDNPLPLIAIGAALVVIGYVGVFFGNLIKAAVSRQREYLADAAAVQFTRNPDGIAGALKKIGGWASHSQLRSASVHEVSHMMFASGLNFWIGLFATHPPLARRIRRIDPSFDGRFPEVKRLQPRAGTAAPPSEPAGRGKQLWQGAAAVAAMEATRRAALQAQRAQRDALRQIGRPTASHMQYARDLLASIAQPVLDAAHDPFGARAVVFGLLIDADAAMRQKQLDQLQLHADKAIYEQTVKLLPQVQALDPAARLPLIDVAAVALRRMSAQQYEAFTRHIDILIRADEKLNIFEWTLQRILLRHVASQFTSAKPARAKYYALRPLTEQISILLSTLAYSGHGNTHDARQAFEMAAHVLDTPGIALQPQSSCGLRVLDRVLDELNTLSPREKRKLLEACAVCISADQEITVREAELFRAIGDSLECPIPPLLPGQPLAKL